MVTSTGSQSHPYGMQAKLKRPAENPSPLTRLTRVHAGSSRRARPTCGVVKYGSETPLRGPLPGISSASGCAPPTTGEGERLQVSVLQGPRAAKPQQLTACLASSLLPSGSLFHHLDLLSLVPSSSPEETRCCHDPNLLQNLLAEPSPEAPQPHTTKACRSYWKCSLFKVVPSEP